MAKEPLAVKVIPANAGVILIKSPPNSSNKSYPRECGGDPLLLVVGKIWKELSPRMRG